jgi:hypothetical protein
MTRSTQLRLLTPSNTSAGIEAVARMVGRSVVQDRLVLAVHQQIPRQYLRLHRARTAKSRLRVAAIRLVWGCSDRRARHDGVGVVDANHGVVTLDLRHSTGVSYMDYKDRYQFCEKAAEYVALVAFHLSERIGEQAAYERVVQRLAIVLENMFDETRPEDIAWSLIPQPHSFPMPR